MGQEVITKKTHNGAEIKIVNTEKFTRNIMSVNFFVPLGDDASRNALLSRVMGLGTSKYKTLQELNEFLEINYGATFNVSVGKKGDNQLIRFSTSFLPDSFALEGEKITEIMTEFLHDAIRNPLILDSSFKHDILDIEKQNLINRINSRINNKRRYALYRCTEEMCSNEIYGIDELGIPEEIQKITLNDLKIQWEKLLGNSKVYISCVGRFDNGKIYHFAEKLLDFERRSDINKTLYITKATKIKTIEEPLEVNQSILAMGYRLGSLNYSDHMFSYMMFNSIFGGNTTSFLFMNVREKLSLCYYCSSMLDRLKGLMLVYAGISAENKDKTYNEITAQLKRICEGDITEEDIADARRDLINRFKEMSDGLTSLEEYYLNCFIGENEMSLDEVIAGLNAVTKEDIVIVANLVTLDTVYFLTDNSQNK